MLRDGRYHSYIRRSLSRLGTVVAAHSLAVVAVAVAIGVSLGVAVPVLYRPVSVANHPRLPGRVWTSLHSLSSNSGWIPDISVKQAWIYGSWMKALERETLLEAANIHDVLLGPLSSYNTVHVETSASGSELAISFPHSPFLYWNSCVTAIKSDNSLLKTINSLSHQVSPANLTLRPSSVLGGIRLSYDRIIAADALIVSLFYKTGSSAGDLWDEGAEALARCDERKQNIYLASSGGTGSRLFKFQYRPISIQDKAIFFAAYSLIALYIIFSLRNLRMIKSRFNLFVTIALQECFSILAGFNLSAFVHRDISNIPLEAYPFIVLTVGLENMFRLTNEVERTPLQGQSMPRIAAALGAVGHLSLTTVAQSFVILWIVSRITPELTALCGFIAISLTVDLVFYFTFFVAMLSVDLRKFGLQDTFDEVHQCEDSKTTEAGMLNGLTQQRRGDVKQYTRYNAYSRLWGVVVISLFLFMLSWHFSDGKKGYHLAREHEVFVDSEFKTPRNYQREFNTTFEQRKDLLSWLETQGHGFMREILRTISSQSYGFLAKVYDPLIVVLKSADRNPSRTEEILVSSAVANSIFGSFWQSLALSCCVVSLILTLWRYSMNEALDEKRDRTLKSGTLSSIQYLPRSHTLDVFMLGTSSRRFLASVGFDHEIRVWNLESQIVSSKLVPVSQQHNLWPVAAIAIDGRAEWLAICSKWGEVSFWNIQLQCFGPSTTTILDTHMVAIFFSPSPHRDSLHSSTRLLLVSAAGRLTDIEVETGNVLSHKICANRVQSSQISSHGRMPLRLITISDGNTIYVTTRRESFWTSQALDFSVPILSQPSRLRFTIIPDLRMIALVLNIDSYQLHLIDLLSGAAIYTFRPGPFRHQTLRAIHSQPQQCLSCGAVALMSFSIAYTEEQDRSFTMITLIAEQNSRFRTGLICLRAERDSRERRCTGFEGSTEKIHTMQHAGIWEATAANGVAGIRYKRPDSQNTSKDFTQNGTLFRRKAQLARRDPKIDDEAWEAWTMTSTGIVNTHALMSGLFTNRVGPICPVGRNAIAVGLAEDIILVRFGNQLHDGDDDDNNNVAVRRQPRTRLAGRFK